VKHAEILDLVRKIAEPLARKVDLDLVDVAWRRRGKSWTLVVTIDAAGGVGSDQCAWMNEQVGRFLDAEDPIPHPYMLEVSSPGLTRELERPRDFELSVGRRIRLRTYAPIGGRKDLSGELVAYDGDALKVKTDDGSEFEIERDAVAKARLDPDLDAYLRRRKKESSRRGGRVRG